MRKYRKKPVVIDAEQWLPVKKYDGISPSVEMPIPPVPSAFLILRKKYWFFGKESWLIKTLEGNLKLTPKDWIICGVKGEFYPCKPDIFAETYEQVKGDD